MTTRAGVHSKAPTQCMVEVFSSDPSLEDHALDAAIVHIEVAATRHNVGIMVTRIGPGHYVVRAHPQVPAGMIRRRS